MFRAVVAVLCLTACSSSYDLKVSTDASTLAIGEGALVKVSGTVDVPKNSTVQISLGYAPVDDRDDWTGDLSFEPGSANPSGIAHFLYPTDDNLAPDVLFDSIDDRPEELIARWRVTCHEPGTYTLFTSSIFTAANGAPVVPSGNNSDAELTCQ